VTPKAEQEFDAEAAPVIWGLLVAGLVLIALIMALAAEYGCA